MRFNKLRRHWLRFWLRYGRLTPFGRLATRLAVWGAPPYKARSNLATLYPHGYTSPTAQIHHPNLHLGRHIFVGDGVVVYGNGRNPGCVRLDDGVHLYGDTIIETGEGGQVVIGAGAHVQPRCQFSAYVGAIHVGRDVEIAPNCAFYPYNHGTQPGLPIREQPLHSKGDIIIGDDAWLGVGVIVLAGVTIGEGAVIGAGSVVTRDVPPHTIATGAPARVGRRRGG
jgi:acetyltransferase-like isoleucine patch superfamily enzyme